MAFLIHCPTCDAPLRLAVAPTRRCRVTCPHCATAIRVAVQVQAAPGRSRRGPTRPAPGGVPTGPPPPLPISRPVVWGGAVASAAASLLLYALLLFLRLPVTDLYVLLPCFCAAYLFGGHFVAASADGRKLTHCYYSALHCALLFVVGLICFVIVRVLQTDPTVNITPKLNDACRALFTGWQVPAVTFALFVSFLVGGLSERLLTGLARALGSRRRWRYVTDDGERIGTLGPWRHPLLAWGWRLAGLAFLLTCWLPLLIADATWFARGWRAAAFLVLGWLCLRLAGKRTARDAGDALQASVAPPVVYLRSFRHDGRKLRGGIWYDYTRMLFATLTSTPEEHLARVLRRAGPFVAVGKPGEELPEAGAARLYVADDDWQAVVSDLLNQPNAVALLQAGETQGLRWELQRIGEDLKPEQVLLFVPFGLWAGPWRRERYYAQFRGWAGPCLGTTLPDYLGHSCFIYFTGKQRWQAHVLRRREPVPPAHPLRSVLRALQRNRALWPRTGVTLLKTLVLLAVLAIPVCFLATAVQKVREAAHAAAQRESAERRPPQAVRHPGKALPYHLTLAADWTEVPAAPGQDRLFHNEQQRCDLAVYAQNVKGNLANALAALTDRMSGERVQPEGTKVFDHVTLQGQRKILVNGKEWIDGKIVGEKPGGQIVWVYYRGYAGAEGTFQLIAGAASDDAATQQLIGAALDAFVLPG